MKQAKHEDLASVRRTIEAEIELVDKKYKSTPKTDSLHEYWFGQLMGLTFALGSIKARMGEE